MNMNETLLPVHTGTGGHRTPTPGLLSAIKRLRLV